MWKSELSQSIHMREDESNRCLQITDTKITDTKPACLFVAYFKTLSVPETTERRELKRLANNVTGKDVERIGHYLLVILDRY